jgi:MoaA/NifB/PqqE/SkfB family radical SAM enzyme
MVAAPYGSDSASCEMDQVRRAAAAGYRYASIPLERDRCVGRHGTHFTPAEAFDRYWRLAQKQKRSGLLAWTNAIPAQFGFRLLAGKGNEADLWGVLGYAAGHIEPLGPERERDFHEQYETFGRLRARMAKPPVGLNVYQTARCNLHCRWCLRTRGQADTGPDVTPRLLEQALDRFPEISVACFAGFGEPLLSETLWECLDVAGKRRLFTQVITNGVLLEERVADLVEHQARNVAVSMNAADPEAYEAATGNPAALFERVVAGVRAAVDAGLRVQISAVLTRSTLHRAPAFAELARTLGVAEVALHNLLPHGVADPEDAGFWGEVLHDGDPEVVEALQRLRVEHGDIVKFWPMPISRTPCPRRCESPFTNVSIDGWGHVGACRRVMPPRQFRIGVSDADIWNSPPFVELREELAGLRELRTECRLCFGNWRG